AGESLVERSRLRRTLPEMRRLDPLHDPRQDSDLCCTGEPASPAAGSVGGDGDYPVTSRWSQFSGGTRWSLVPSIARVNDRWRFHAGKNRCSERRSAMVAAARRLLVLLLLFTSVTSAIVAQDFAVLSKEDQAGIASLSERLAQRVKIKEFLKPMPLP